METTEVKSPATVPEEKNKTPKEENRVPEKSAPQPPKPKKKSKWPKRIIILVVVAAVLVFLLSRCMGGGQVAAGNYLSSTAVRQDMTVSVSGTGTIEPIHSYKVTSLIRGEVLEAPFEEGDVVQEGDLLFRIDSKDVQSTIQQQEINLKNAQLTYDNLQKNQQVKAGATGTVTRLYVDQGDSVTAGAPIADILDRTNMKLTVPFHTSDAASFYVGQSATVTVGGTLETLTGTVDSISASDSVGAGGTLVRNVTVKVKNPGVLTDSSTGSAAVNGASCASNGTFAYNASQQVISKASGEIKSLNVKEGDNVTDGQVLVSFDSEGLESARLSIESAQLALKSARDTLEDYSITSSITGTVIEKNVDVGDNIDSTTTTTASVTYPAVIYDLSAFTFDIDVHELDIGKIKVGQEVRITASAVEGKTFTGVVDKVNINGTTANGVTTYPVTVLVSEPGELLPGMNVSAVIVSEEATNVLSIPVEFVSQGNTVLVAGKGCLDEKGNVVNPALIETRVVTLGRNNDAYIEILDGVEEGETVLRSVSSSSFMNMMG